VAAPLERDVASDSARIAGWLVLAIGDLRLALPQGEARQIELASDLDAQDGDRPEAGWLPRRTGAPWPAYNLDAALRAQRPAPAGRRLCVFFGTHEDVRGVLCDRVWPLAADADLQGEPMPGCMTGPLSPAAGLARFQGGVTLVTSAAALRAYLDSAVG
jgi:hypothetical protein